MIYELSYRSREDKPKRGSVHCNVCGFIIETDKDIAEYVAGAHMRDPEYVGHKTKVVKP